MTITSRATIAIEIGITKERAAVPAIARMIRISCVAYAVEDSASEEKTARPTALPIAWWGASAVESGRPISQARQLERRRASDSRRDCAAEAPGLTKDESFTFARRL